MKHETAVFGGGCFWCVEAVFTKLKGITSVTSGYAGGTTENPTYGDVSDEKTGHAEVIKIEFDPTVITYNDLLEVFFAAHDPITLNRQGNDVGTQYRSIILFTTEEQKKIAEEMIKKMTKKYSDHITTQLQKLDTFYSAEDYHQKYFEKNPDNPYCQVTIPPKLKKLEMQFGHLLK
ncbi:peptide-methionine (S)-S-oxide reductase [Candidatus Roizmanbacteria bacterium RIFCSPLOWO2_02_FULL_37_19]|uniref:Peptide methionine sulfoxide reductase MsrA n=1 Tax=Candidatus Roizmanbacteria bacterium RIFCSPHIGHO2_02_FULL_37_24 TaxID=1802037 RepID=A0A1F7GU58_9BACT|nr:MAG: peptide-methionine (S)-S-oxide reductase [Candidatus Roizmanbacteria bacterium RIFCSPHIGHO2_01_FULL_38_41]OGK22597.1 MAG: peptide-methionine (S)-S-oxide reductase [Candidatus Roizmanbacteria bacterium RIFCSPHIGHO2_02_FULL_37_24]OGK32197.1 MAG: peptide-methionine (S)-S-oxide reductase [Candidatus Roizmanbacteria bacterium RIFCSPHIGHO2_12_FULL_37_23]OGK44466.1 MAG: peptide-methionine (S)-S-oxide reductase [Candidatus Roizmanbacteria bacterium RIFCSPLOWO2_01_FULL_37_57]OGK53783.1 MAG: pept